MHSRHHHEPDGGRQDATAARRRAPRASAPPAQGRGGRGGRTSSSRSSGGPRDPAELEGGTERQGVHERARLHAEDVAARGARRHPARTRSSLRLPDRAQRLPVGLLRAVPARHQLARRVRQARDARMDEHHGRRKLWCRRRDPRQPALPRQGAHAGLLAVQPGRRPAQLPLGAARPARHRRQGGPARPRARRRRRHAAHGHGLVGPAAVVQPRKDDARRVGHGRPHRHLLAQQHLLGLGRVRRHAACRHGFDAHVQPVAQLDRPGRQTSRTSLQEPDRLPHQDLADRGRARLVQGLGRSPRSHRAAHGRHARRQRVHLAQVDRVQAQQRHARARLEGGAGPLRRHGEGAECNIVVVHPLRARCERVQS